jgi:hypothetical protein
MEDNKRYLKKVNQWICVYSQTQYNVELSYTVPMFTLDLSFRRAQHFALASVVKLVGYCYGEQM